MRTFVYAMGLATSMALAFDVAYGAPRGGGGMEGGNRGNNISGNAQVGGDRADSNTGKSDAGVRNEGNVGRNVESAAEGRDGDRGRDNVGVNVDRGRVGVNVDRNRSGDRGRLGDRDYDRHGIGALDDSRYRGRNDNRWRFTKWHNQWWYWMPAGYWMAWDGGRWNRYDEGSYVDNYYNDQQPIASNASGPYYEDQNGFYSFEGNRKVYDPQIRRVNSVGRALVPEGALPR
jgi:hypothetical protein